MSEEKKKDALADALNALAAGEHVEEQQPLSGSGISGHAHDDHVTLSPAAGAPKPGGLPPRAPRTASPPRSATTPPPAKSPVRQETPGIQSRQTAPAPPAKGATLKPGGAVPTRPVNQTTPPPSAGAPQRSPAPGDRRPVAPRPAAPTGGVGRPTAPPPPPRVAPAPVNPPARTFVPPAAPRPATAGGSSSRPPAPAAMPRQVAPPQAPAAKPPISPQPPAPSGDAFVVHDDTVAPSAHHLSDHDAEVAREAEAIAHVVEDDDTLNMPAPGPEAFAPRPAPVRPKRQSVSRTVEFKQTIIPVMLTQGVLLPGIAVYVLALGDESPLVGNAWIPFTLLGIGLLMLLFAGLTMLQVRHQLAHAAAT
jgi:hypothetical protein